LTKKVSAHLNKNQRFRGKAKRKDVKSAEERNKDKRLETNSERKKPRI
jgi:hypothetical protein